jgi:serine/threonine-protein kinase RsbT
MHDLIITKRDIMPIRTAEDVVRVRQAVRIWSADIGLSLVDQTKIVTAASELARNTVLYGGGGSLYLETVIKAGRRGLRLAFEDHGPGIPDVERALMDGYSSGVGLGLGLGGAKRLSNEFSIQTAPGEGTLVTIARWK